VIIPADLNGGESPIQGQDDKGESYYFSMMPDSLYAIFVEMPKWRRSRQWVPLFAWFYKEKMWCGCQWKRHHRDWPGCLL